MRPIAIQSSVSVSKETLATCGVRMARDRDQRDISALSHPASAAHYSSCLLSRACWVARVRKIEAIFFGISQ